MYSKKEKGDKQVDRYINRQIDRQMKIAHCSSIFFCETLLDSQVSGTMAAGIASADNTVWALQDTFLAI